MLKQLCTECCPPQLHQLSDARQQGGPLLFAGQCCKGVRLQQLCTEHVKGCVPQHIQRVQAVQRLLEGKAHSCKGAHRQKLIPAGSTMDMLIYIYCCCLGGYCWRWAASRDCTQGTDQWLLCCRMC